MNAAILFPLIKIHFFHLPQVDFINFTNNHLTTKCHVHFVRILHASTIFNMIAHGPCYKIIWELFSSLHILVMIVNIKLELIYCWSKESGQEPL